MKADGECKSAQAAFVDAAYLPGHAFEGPWVGSHQQQHPCSRGGQSHRCAYLGLQAVAAAAAAGADRLVPSHHLGNRCLKALIHRKVALC